MSRTRTQGGYSLVEVVVAFALLALALTILLGAMSGATRQLRWSDEAGRAALHARALLADLGVDEPLRPGRRSGELEDGRYRWALEVRPWEDPGLPPAAAPVAGGAEAMRMQELELQVAWGERAGEQLVVRSLRLLPPAERP